MVETEIDNRTLNIYDIMISNCYIMNSSNNSSFYNICGSQVPQTIYLSLDYYDIDTLVIDNENKQLIITEKRKNNGN